MEVVFGGRLVGSGADWAAGSGVGGCHFCLNETRRTEATSKTKAKKKEKKKKKRSCTGDIRSAARSESVLQKIVGVKL